MATENTIRFRNAARSYSKRARILVSHDSNVSTPSSGVIKDSRGNSYDILKDGSIRHKWGKKNSRRDNIRRFGKFMGRASDELRREVNELSTAI